MVEYHAQHLDEIFRALGDRTRRAMLRRLANEELTVSELADPYDMSLAAASKHLKVLERAGLIERKVTGRTHRCRLAPRRLGEAYEWLRFYEGFWSERLDTLERELNKDEGE